MNETKNAPAEITLPEYITSRQYRKWGEFVPAAIEIEKAAARLSYLAEEKEVPSRLTSNLIKSNAAWLRDRMECEAKRTDEKLPQFIGEIFHQALRNKVFPDPGNLKLAMTTIMRRADERRGPNHCIVGIVHQPEPEEDPEAMNLLTTTMPDSARWQAMEPSFTMLRDKICFMLPRQGSRKRARMIVAMPIENEGETGTLPEQEGQALRAAQIIIHHGGIPIWREIPAR